MTTPSSAPLSLALTVSRPNLVDYRRRGGAPEEYFTASKEPVKDIKSVSNSSHLPVNSLTVL